MSRAGLAAAMVLALAGGAPAQTAPAGSALALEALRLCAEADLVAPPERLERWRHGLAAAEAAVEHHPDDPVAHFALFCNLGKRVSSGPLGLAGLVTVPRLRRHIDRALVLAPAYVDALAAKGAFLARLPAVLGGDPDEGERLLRQALALAPHHADARRQLAGVLRLRGQDADAAEELRQAEAPAVDPAVQR